MANPKNTQQIDKEPGVYGPFMYVQIAVVDDFPYPYSATSGHIFLTSETRDPLYIHVRKGGRLYLSRSETDLAGEASAEAYSFNEVGRSEWTFLSLDPEQWEHWEGSDDGWPYLKLGRCVRKDDTYEEIL